MIGLPVFPALDGRAEIERSTATTGMMAFLSPASLRHAEHLPAMRKVLLSLNDGEEVCSVFCSRDEGLFYTKHCQEVMEMAECELLANCGFFKKHQASKDLICRGLVAQYCKGAKQNDCKRKQYRQQHGTPPNDDMMPSGQTMS